MQIFIKTMNGRTITLDVDPCLTIKEIKILLELSDGIPVSQQRFIYNGKQLENNRTLADYNI